jgi:hypothetical protein
MNQKLPQDLRELVSVAVETEFVERVVRHLNHPNHHQLLVLLLSLVVVSRQTKLVYRFDSEAVVLQIWVPIVEEFEAEQVQLEVMERRPFDLSIVDYLPVAVKEFERLRQYYSAWLLGLLGRRLDSEMRL